MKKELKVNQDFSLVNAKYKLNTSEIKFILNAISQIDSIKDEVLKEYQIKVSELEQKLQAEQNSTRLKQFAKKLMSKPLEVPVENGFLIFNWFSKIRYFENEKIFKVRIDEDLKPYLLQLKERFVSYNLKYILPLTSSYSVRIYQLLKEYENLKIRYFDLKELQELLKVPKSFVPYGKFKQKVLKVAERELKEHTDIYFDLEEEKIGRKVTKLIFKIRQNINNTKNVPSLFENETNEYTQYLDRSCTFKKVFYDKIRVITPYADGSLKVEFTSSLSQNGKDEKPIVTFKNLEEFTQNLRK